MKTPLRLCVLVGVPLESSGRRLCWQLCPVDAVTQKPTLSPVKSSAAAATCPTSTSSASSCSALTWWAKLRRINDPFCLSFLITQFVCGKTLSLLSYNLIQPPDSKLNLSIINSGLCFTACQVKWDQSQTSVDRIALQRLSSSSFKRLTLSSPIPSSSENSHIRGFC